MKKEIKKPESKKIPLGGDYALDANDNPIVVYEEGTPRQSNKK